MTVATTNNQLGRRAGQVRDIVFITVKPLPEKYADFDIRNEGIRPMDFWTGAARQVEGFSEGFNATLYKNDASVTGCRYVDGILTVSVYNDGKIDTGEILGTATREVPTPKEAMVTWHNIAKDIIHSSK